MNTSRTRIRIVARRWLVALATLLLATPSHAIDAPDNYRLGAGDSIRVTVFQNPDMTVETRVSEDGSISYPLIRSVSVGGLAIDAAEKRIAAQLDSGGFLRKPQINIQLLQIKGNKVSVLGQVNRPGSFPLETFNARVSQLLAEAGGVSAAGADRIIVTGARDGKAFRREIDIDALYRSDRPADDIVVAGGDTLYVPRAPTFYIYGEVTRPGNYRIDRDMTMRQALAAGGGLTARGTERRLKVVRRTDQGAQEKVSTSLDARVNPDDVIYVEESIF